MGNLNFNMCNVDYDPSIISLDIKTNDIVIFYDFTNYLKKETSIKFYIQTSFINDLVLKFNSNEEIHFNIKLKKGEQSFTYYSISFNVLKEIFIPLFCLNPYTSSINFNIMNNKKRGVIKISKEQKN